jgi:hypothetical protein
LFFFIDRLDFEITEVQVHVADKFELIDGIDEIKELKSEDRIEWDWLLKLLWIPIRGYHE